MFPLTSFQRNVFHLISFDNNTGGIHFAP